MGKPANGGPAAAEELARAILHDQFIDSKNSLLLFRLLELVEKELDRIDHTHGRKDAP
jgi:hypothetical protein